MPDQCGHPLRGGTCTLDPGHRGRHRTATYRCDGCNKARLGQPEAWSRDGEYEKGLAFCFLCVVADERERDRLAHLSEVTQGGL